MAPNRTACRWLIACFGILLGVLSMNATAIDPGTVTGKLTHKGKTYSLRHVYAWQPPGQTKEMWVYLTDSELPAATAQGALKLEELAKGNRFRGVKLVFNPAKPNLKESHFDLFVSEEDIGEIRMSSFQFWQRLSVGDKRVMGRLKFDLGEWLLDAEFSAPVFGRNLKVQTLTGAQAVRPHGRDR